MYPFFSFPSSLFNFTNIVLSCKSKNSITISNIVTSLSSCRSSLERPQLKNSPNVIANGISKFTSTLSRKIFVQRHGVDIEETEMRSYGAVCDTFSEEIESNEEEFFVALEVL